MFRDYDFKKIGIPKYIKLMGLNNELQIGLLLKIDSQSRNKGTENYLQIMIVN